MELFTVEFLYALLSIVIIDLVLAGDNAIVIGMAARNLPKDQQKKIIIWGTVGAIILRALATLAVVWLLKIPGLMLAGGVMLIWIAYKLLTEENNHEVKASTGFWSAMQTIIVADVVMGLDNVLAVAGAAHGNFVLVVLGLIISIPIVVWGSTLILKWMDRFPSIIYIGAGVLAFTAAKMLTGEKMLSSFFAQSALLEWGLIVTIVAGVLYAGRYKKQSAQKEQSTQNAA